jgi:hypothetical protein
MEVWSGGREKTEHCCHLKNERAEWL